jgi:hypothetical protein
MPSLIAQEDCTASNELTGLLLTAENERPTAADVIGEGEGAA